MAFIVLRKITPRNVDVSTTGIFLNFSSNIRRLRHGLCPLPLTVNVASFKNRAFKSNDASSRRYQSRQGSTEWSRGEKEKKDEAVKKDSRKGSEIGSFSGSRCGSRWNGERAQCWRIVHSRKGSICPHNFTDIACQECRWKVDYCFSIRSARRFVRLVSLLNGRRWRENSISRHLEQSLKRNLSSSFSIIAIILRILHLNIFDAQTRARN